MQQAYNPYPQKTHEIFDVYFSDDVLKLSEKSQRTRLIKIWDMNIVSKKTVKKTFENKPKKKDDELRYQEYDRNVSVGKGGRTKITINFIMSLINKKKKNSRFMIKSYSKNKRH